MKKLLFAASAMLLMASCSQNKQDNRENAESASPASKSLVLYYSQTGATKTLADSIASMLGADIAAVETVIPYPDAYDATIKQCQKEIAIGKTPSVKPLACDIAQYDTIYLGYPIWFGTYARPIMGLLSDNDFTGKVIVPFCTFGSGGLEASAADLATAVPGATIADGYGVRTARIARIADELPYFLISNGYMAGEVTPLPDYSDQQPVNEQEVEIFNAACGSYPFPLGTPVTVGSRTCACGTDYKYTVATKTFDGKDAEGIVYVTVAAGEDAVPEFTKVVR